MYILRSILSEAIGCPMGNPGVSSKERHVSTDVLGMEGFCGPAVGALFAFGKSNRSEPSACERERENKREAAYRGKFCMSSLTRITAWSELTSSSHVSNGRAPRRKT